MVLFYFDKAKRVLEYLNWWNIYKTEVLYHQMRIISKQNDIYYLAIFLNDPKKKFTYYKIRTLV